MRKILFISAFICALAFAAAAQTTTTLKLRQGQQKKVEGVLAVKFLSVPEDSRCPKGVECIWAGVARIKIQLQKDGKTKEVEFNTNQMDKIVAFEGYSIQLTGLEPYPRSGPKNKPDAYSATFLFTKLTR